MILYVTFGSKHEARRVVRTLLEERLIKCANMLSSDSLYVWNDSVKEENEIVAILKSSNEFSIVSSRIEELHSYEVPCIIEIDGRCNQKFLSWLDKK